MFVQFHFMKKSSEILAAHADSISELIMYCLIDIYKQQTLHKKTRCMYNHMHLEFSPARNGIRTRDLRLGKATLHL